MNGLERLFPDYQHNRAVQKKLQSMTLPVLDKLYNLAVEGDVSACRAILGKTLADIKENPIFLEGMTPPTDLNGTKDYVAALLQAAAEGRLTVSQARGLIDAATSFAETVIASDVQQQLEKLEKQLGYSDTD